MNLINEKNVSNERFQIYRDGNATGSEQIYILNPALGQRYAYTDGVRSLFISKNAYWIRDIVFSFAHLINKSNEEFVVFNVFKKISKEDEVVFLATDGNGNVLFHQNIPYSDIGINIELYLYGDNERKILLLPSEY